MGLKNSVLKVTSRVSVPGDCTALDAIRVSYRRPTCCGSRRRQIASFSFKRDKWLQQLSPEGMQRNTSADVASVHVGKLSKKDGNTAVRVKCLAGKVSVFTTEMSLADFLARLKYTEGGGKAVLSFSLAGRRLEATGAHGHAYTVMFCNGMRLENGGAQHLSGPPQHHHQPHHNTQPDNAIQKQLTPHHGLEDVMDEVHPSLNVQEVKEAVMGEEDPSQDVEGEQKEEEEVMVEEDPSLDKVWQTEEKDDPPLDVEWEEEQKVMSEENPLLDEEWETEEEEVMGEEDSSLKVEWVEKEEKVMDKGGASLNVEGKRAKESQGHVRTTLWHHVGDCAAVVALGLMLYNAWLEYNTH